MQFTKDSFYMALRDRLAALNPQRTVTLERSDAAGGDCGGKRDW